MCESVNAHVHVLDDALHHPVLDACHRPAFHAHRDALAAAVLRGGLQRALHLNISHHARWTVEIRKTLLTTERLFWHVSNCQAGICLMGADSII